MLPEHRSTRRAFRAEDAPEWIIEALKNADYSHLKPYPQGPRKRDEDVGG